MAIRKYRAVVVTPKHRETWVYPNVVPLLKLVVPDVCGWPVEVSSAMGDDNDVDAELKVVLSVRQWWTNGWSEKRAKALCAEEGITLLWLDFDPAVVYSHRVGDTSKGHLIKAPRQLKVTSSKGACLATADVLQIPHKPKLEVCLGKTVIHQTVKLRLREPAMA